MTALLDELLACETTVWEALISGDIAADAAALSADFLGVYPDGFSGKAGHSEQLSGGPTVRDYNLSEVRVMALGGDHALLAYRATYRRTGREEREEMFVSSVWRRQGTEWINVFSQDTPATGIPVP